jgi:hypothetical protein
METLAENDQIPNLLKFLFEIAVTTYCKSIWIHKGRTIILSNLLANKVGSRLNKNG